MFIIEKPRYHPVLRASIDDKVESIWPGVLSLPGQYDLALLDLPFAHTPTPYTHNQIPYKTFSVKELE